ncbi:MAG: hypothetical protein QGG40_08910 [Myxococcota bacterium]|jgi:hypothetical protein|nr:hypothetical protein [Myxococcota bacterium]
MPPLLHRAHLALEDRLSRWLGPRRHLLSGARANVDSLSADITSLEHSTEATRARIDALSIRRQNRQFRAEETIDAIWRRHPGVGELFEEHGLPSCNHCAVRFDETLREAAEAYQVDLDRLLRKLNGLLA